MASLVRAIRPLVAVGRVAFPKLAAVSARRAVVPASVVARSFSASVARWGHGRADVDLSKQLQNEIDHEHEEHEAYKEEDKSVEKFLTENEWQVDAKPNSSEITMSKTFGNEKIRVIFSLSDINDNDTEQFMDDVEDNVNEEMDDPSFTVNAVISCEKPDKGVLTFETQIADGGVEILSVVHYPNATIAHGADSESDWQRRGLYSGPLFTQLEEDLQSQFAEYLEERGINTGFAVFVPQFIESREQKEYVNWLGKVKEYVDA